MENKNSFAVCCTYNFDTDAAVYLFDTQQEAVDWLRASLLEAHRIDTEENGWDSSYEISEDELYGKITTRFADHDDITEYRVANVYSCE